MADMTEKGTSAVAQTSKLESETKVEDESGKELTAAAALTSLISSAVLSTGESEEHADVTGDKEGNTASDTEFDIPQRYTSSGRKRAVSFPLKLMKVLSTKCHADVIAWMPSGKSFSILDSKRFVADILPQYFKCAKFPSFTRKLHRWGFIRHYRGEEAGAYYHDKFQKGRFDLVETMTCSKQEPVQHSAMSLPLEKQREEQAPVPKPSTNIPSMPLQRPASALQSAMARSRLQTPLASQIGASDLNAAIEFEVARRIQEKINEDAINRRALALLREQQLMQQRQQDQHLLLQLKRQQAQRLQLLAASMPLANQNQLRWSQQGISMLKTSIPIGKLSFPSTPGGNRPLDAQPFQSLPKTNITGAKTA